MNKVKRIKDNYNKMITKFARKVMKESKVKEVLKDLKIHFKTGKYPLDYDYYSNLIHSWTSISNKILELSGYKIYYNGKVSPNVMIKQRKLK